MKYIGTALHQIRNKLQIKRNPNFSFTFLIAIRVRCVRLIRSRAQLLTVWHYMYDVRFSTKSNELVPISTSFFSSLVLSRLQSPLRIFNVCRCLSVFFCFFVASCVFGTFSISFGSPLLLWATHFQCVRFSFSFHVRFVAGFSASNS